LGLRYTPKALAELDEILTYVAERSPRGSQKVQRRIRMMVDLLAEHPHAGQVTSEQRLRRIVVIPYPYLIFYAATEDEVVVIGVRHAARDPSTMPDFI
jgi:plasmid stabilization system protein ParE